jgi:hypothetical protein
VSLSNSSAGRPYEPRHYLKKHQQDQLCRPERRSLSVRPAQAGLLRPVGTPLSPDQGIVFHDRLIPAEPKPFEQALRKIEFIHGRLWGICPADKNGRR